VETSRVQSRSFHALNSHGFNPLRFAPHRATRFGHLRANGVVVDVSQISRAHRCWQVILEYPFARSPAVRRAIHVHVH